MQNYEVRYTADCEFRAEATGKTFQISGYAALFDTRSENLGGFIEVIPQGAFTETVQSSDIRALWNHNSDHVLGRNTAGSLRVGQDTRGLHYEVDLLDTEFNRALVMQIERGDISQSSFGFTKVEDDWEPMEDGMWIRTLIKADVFDVSPVTYPATLDTSVATRSLNLWTESRNTNLVEVRNDLTKTTQGTDKPVATTYDDPFFDDSDILVIRSRMNRV